MMIKRLISVLALSFAVATSACAQEQYKEGEHYKVISSNATETPEVVEFFSFWCPHCYNFEPIVDEVKKKLADDVEFKKVHVNFMRFASAETQNEATRAMLVGRALKQEENFNAALFNLIHVQRKPVTGLDDVKNLLAGYGVDADKFEKTAKGFGVNSLLSRNNSMIDAYRQHLSGVPNFIINGKYQAQLAGGMTADEIVDLLVWLSEQE